MHEIARFVAETDRSAGPDPGDGDAYAS